MVRKKAFVLRKECVACGSCLKLCPKGAIKIVNGLFAEVNHDLCVGCQICKNECPASIIKMEEISYEE